MAHAARPPAAVFARRFRFLDVSLWKNTSFFTAAFPFISSPAFDYSSRVQVPSQVTAEPESQAPSHRGTERRRPGVTVALSGTVRVT